MGKVKKSKERVNSKPKTKFAYKKEHMKIAVEEVLKGATIAEISRKYNIPESTLRDKKNCRYADKNPGASTVLSKEEETNLAGWIFNCSKRGFTITKRQLLESVQMLCGNDKRKTPFLNNKPGRRWFDGFLHRHPGLSQRIAENVSLNRVKVSENNIRSWFTEITEYLAAEDLLLIHPSRIFVADETGVPLNSKSSKVLAKKSPKSVYKVNNEKENVTVLVTANAEGTLAPPLVTFAGKSVPKDTVRLAPANYTIGFSDNGWMRGKNFFEYIANVFYPWLEKSGIELPIIMYMDGHSSNMTLSLSQFCEEKKIVLVALFPNSTHILQPLDVSFFRPFKASWQKSFQNFCKSNGTMSIKKPQVTLVLEKTLTDMNIKEILEKGFETCGLHPLNVNAINFEKAFTRIYFSNEASCESEPAASSNKNMKALKSLENLLAKEKLKMFRSHTSPNWTGEIEDTSLFKIWYSLKNSSEVGISINNDIKSSLEKQSDDSNAAAISSCNKTSTLSQNSVADKKEK